MQNYFDDGDLFPLSWLSQYGYCPRRCGLLAIDGIWVESADTAAGRAGHQRVHHSSVSGRFAQIQRPFRRQKMKDAMANDHGIEEIKEAHNKSSINKP